MPDSGSDDTDSEIIPDINGDDESEELSELECESFYSGNSRL